jgi:formaldehyde-activating enzyme involved in methanogenesis
VQTGVVPEQSALVVQLGSTQLWSTHVRPTVQPRPVSLTPIDEQSSAETQHTAGFGFVHAASANEAAAATKNFILPSRSENRCCHDRWSSSERDVRM